MAFGCLTPEEWHEYEALAIAEQRREFERQFLIRLAPVWLACRWRVMGHSLTNFKRVWPKPDLSFDLLGMVDYQHEMRLICEQELNRG